MFGKKLPAYYVYLIIEGAYALGFVTFATLSSLYRIQVVGLNPFELVLVGTVLELTVFMLEVPTGVVADLYSRRLSVIIGVFVVGIGFAFEGLFPYLATVLIAQFIWGAGWTFISGARQAWITDELGEEGIGRVFLRGDQFYLGAAIVAIPIAVALGSIDVALPLVAGGAMLIALALFLIAVMPEDGFTRTPRGERTTFGSMLDTTREGIGTIRGRPVLVTIILIAALSGAASEGYDRLYQKHLIDNFTFPDLPTGPLDNIVVWFGLISVLGMGANILIAEVVRRRIDTDSHRVIARTLLVSTSLLVAAIAGFALAGSFAVAFAFVWAIAVFRGLNDPLTITWLNQNVASRVRATVISMNGQADAFGQIAGGPILGIIATVISLRFNFLVVALILVPALLLYVRTLRVGEVTGDRVGEGIGIRE